MKRTSIVLLTAAFLFAISSFAIQQPAGNPQGGEGHKHMGHGMPTVEEHLKMLTDELSLTPDQQAKAKPILEEHHQQMQAFMKDDSLSKEDRKKKMQAMHDDFQTKLGAVLTDEQKKKFAEMHKNMPEHMGEKHEHRHGDDHPHN